MNNYSDLYNVKNSVAPCNLSLGKDNPISLKSKEGYAYRVTGIDQINDIINCGYVRPKEYGVRGQNHGDIIYWSIGGNVCYYDKRPVLEISLSKVHDGQIGAIPLDDLSGIWIYDEITNSYVNKIENIKSLYVDLQDNYKHR